VIEIENRYSLKINVKDNEDITKIPKYTRNDRATLEFLIFDDETQIDTATLQNVNITVTKDGITKATNELTVADPLEYTFGDEIDEPGDYLIRLQLYSNGGRVTTFPFNVVFEEDFCVGDPSTTNQDVLSGIYLRLSSIESENQARIREIQGLQQDLPNKLDKNTTEKQIVVGDVEFQGNVDILALLRLLQPGQTITTDQLQVLQRFFTINEGFTGTPPAGYKYGLILNRGDKVSYGLIVDEDNQTINGGDFEIDENQNILIDKTLPLLFRKQSADLHPGGYLVWNGEKFIAETANPNKLFVDLPLQSITQLDVTEEKYAELKEIVGKSEIVISDADLERSRYFVNDTHKNSITYTNGLPYMDEKVVKVKLWEWAGDILHRVNSDVNTYRFDFLSLTPTNNIKAYSTNAIVQNIPNIIYEQSGNDKIHWAYAGANGVDFGLWILKTDIDNQTGSTMVDKLKAYLNSVKPYGIFELAIPNPKSKVIDNNVTASYVSYFTNHIRLADVNINEVVSNGLRVTTDQEIVNMTLKDNNVTYTPDAFVNRANDTKTFSQNRTDGKLSINIPYSSSGLSTTSTVQDCLNYLINANATLTYQLATPRLAETLGFNHVVNPKLSFVGKQLFDKNTIYSPIQDYKGLLQSSRRGNKRIVSPSTEYTLTSSGSNHFSYYDNDNKYISGGFFDTTGTLVKGSTKLTTPQNAHYIVIAGLKTGGTFDTDFDIVQLEEGPVATDYVPFQKTEQSITGTFKSISDTIRDRVVNENGLYFEIRELEEVRLWEETVTPVYHQPNHYNFKFSDLMINKKLKSIASKNYGFVNGLVYKYAEDDTRHYYNSVSSLHIFVEKPLIDEITTMTTGEQTILGFLTPDTLEKKFRVYLYRDNVTGLYQLATPTKTPLVYTGGALKLLPGGTAYVESEGLLDDVTITYADNDRAAIEMMYKENRRLIG
jgi:hypothetical protein